jgi:hypothetical protein
LSIKRQEALRRATINPAQQRVLNQIQARQNYQRSNPEGRVIPSTNGQIFQLNELMDEIDRATRLVD